MGEKFANPRQGLAISAGSGFVSTGTVTFANSNGVTFGAQASASSTVVTASVAAGAAFTAIQSLSAGTTQITSGQVVLGAGGGIGFGVNGQTITAGFTKMSSWDNRQPPTKDDIQSMQQGVVYINALNFDHPIDATRADFIGFLTVPGSQSGAYSVSLGFYTLNGSTASLASSTLLSASWSSGTNSTTASVYGGQSDFRWRSVSLATWAITPGEYIVASVQSTSGNVGSNVGFRFVGAESNPAWFPEAEQLLPAYWGPLRSFATATTGALPASMVLATSVWQNVNQSSAYMRLMGTY